MNWIVFLVSLCLSLIGLVFWQINWGDKQYMQGYNEGMKNMLRMVGTDTLPEDHMQLLEVMAAEREDENVY